MTEGDSEREVVRYWWEKAEGCLASAQRELAAGALEFAADRLYYALFYTVSAALAERGHSARRHSGIRASFHREFIRTGLLPEELGRLYDHLFEDRQEGDYVVFVAFERSYLAVQLERCRLFLGELRPLVRALDDPA